MLLLLLLLLLLPRWCHLPPRPQLPPLPPLAQPPLALPAGTANMHWFCECELTHLCHHRTS